LVSVKETGCGLLTCGILCGVGSYLVTDVSGYLVGPISKCQAVRRLDVCSVGWDADLICYVDKVSASGLATLPELEDVSELILRIWVLAALTVQIDVFWHVTPCSLLKIISISEKYSTSIPKRQ
jgi:hypothetical protein